MKVSEFLEKWLLDERLNYKSIFTVYFNKKYYSCTIQELNQVFGRCKCEWIYKKGQNWFQIKVA